MTNQEAIKIIEDECEHIKSHLKCKGKAEDFYKELGDMCIAFYMAIKALEQEPKLRQALEQEKGAYNALVKNIQCADAISRQAVLDIDFHRIMHTTAKPSEMIRQEIINLPPVNQQEPKYCDRNICVSNEYNGIGCDECEVTKSREPKTGHWIAIDEEPHEDYECDNCGYTISTYTANIKPHTEYKFCPNCGAKMVEPQESEEQE